MIVRSIVFLYSFVAMEILKNALLVVISNQASCTGLSKNDLVLCVGEVQASFNIA